MGSKIKIPRFKQENGFIASPDSSKIMSKIRHKDTKPEVLLRKALWSLGIRYRSNYKKLKGCPDIAMLKYKLLIFVDGEFWHGYEWEKRKPKLKSNREYWIPKIERNMQRDIETNDELQNAGFTVMRFWEHEIKKNLNGCIEKIITQLQN